jgi:hypothetical protein
MPPELNQIQEDLGLVSIKGTSLNSQSIVLPQLSVRQSISRPVIRKSEKEVEEEKMKGLTLQELVSQIKSEKEANDFVKKEKEIEANIFD